MYYQNLKYSGMFIVLAFFAFTLLTSCEEEENGDPNKDETEVWQAHEFTPNTTFKYNLEAYDASQDEITSGNVVIEIGDPEVTATATFPEGTFSETVSSSSNISRNYDALINKVPGTAPLQYETTWFKEFSGQELEVGASWSFSNAGGSATAEITGKDTYIGREGFVFKLNVQADDEKAIVTTCIDPSLPISMMISVESEPSGDWFKMELTSYED